MRDKYSVQGEYGESLEAILSKKVFFGEGNPIPCIELICRNQYGDEQHEIIVNGKQTLRYGKANIQDYRKESSVRAIEVLRIGQAIRDIFTMKDMFERGDLQTMGEMFEMGNIQEIRNSQKRMDERMRNKGIIYITPFISDYQTVNKILEKTVLKDRLLPFLSDHRELYELLREPFEENVLPYIFGQKHIYSTLGPELRAKIPPENQPLLGNFLTEGRVYFDY